MSLMPHRSDLVVRWRWHLAGEGRLPGCLRASSLEPLSMCCDFIVSIACDRNPIMGLQIATDQHNSSELVMMGSIWRSVSHPTQGTTARNPRGSIRCLRR